MSTSSLRRLRARRCAGEAGFTLPELIVTISIIAVIVSAIAGALIVSLKTQTATAGTLAESHDQQRLAFWLPKDIESAVLSSIDVQSGTGTGCAGATPAGTNVLRLLSVDSSTGSTSTYFASYRIEGAVAPYQLVRYQCAQGQAFSRQVMAEYLPATTSAIATVVNSKVTMTVTTSQSAAGLTFSISGTPRTTVLGGGSNGGNSCMFSNGSVTPSNVGMNGANLAQNVAVSVTSTGACSALVLGFDTGSGGQQTIALAGGPTTWTATIGANAYSWTTGVKTLSVLGTSNSGSLLLAVGSLCTFQGGNASPASVGLSGSNLASNVTISITTTGVCSLLGLSFDTGTGLRSLALTGGPITWSAAITTSQYPWAAGSHPFTVTGTTNGGTVPFTVLGPCTYVNGSSTPNPVTIGAGGTIASAVDFAVTTTGACSGITLTVQTGTNNGSNQTAILAENPLGSSVWKGTVATNAFTSWTVGAAKPVTVNGTTTAGAGFTMDVQAGCAFATGVANPNPVTIGNGGTLATALAFTVTSTGPCTALSLTIPTGSATQTVALTGGPSTWTANVAANAFSTWTVGAKTVAVTGTTNGGSFTLTVQNPPCTFVSGSTNPATVTLLAAAPSALASGFTVAVTTSGVCSPLTVTIPISSGNQNVALTEAVAASGNWSGSVGAADFAWTAGTKAVTVNGTANGGTFNLSVLGACTFVPGSGSATPDPVLMATSGGTLSGTLTLSVTTSGNCAGSITVTVPTGTAPTANNQTVVLSGGPTAWTATIPATAYTTWTAGTKTATVNTTVGGTFAFAVQAPCVFTAGSASPNPIGVAGNSGLLSDLAIAVTTTGTCSPLTVSVPTGGGTASATLTEAPAGSGNWTGTILKQAFTTWKAGGKTMNVAGTANPAASVIAFTAQLVPCTMSSGSAAPSPVNLFSNGSLEQNPVFTAVTAGTCKNVTTSVATGTATATVALIETTPGGGTWTGSLPAATTWTVGTKSVAVLNNATAPAVGMFNVVVQASACSYVSGSVSLNGAKVAGGKLNKDITFTLTTSGTCTTPPGLTVQTGATAGVNVAVMMTANGANVWTATLTTGSPTTWTAGTKTVTINNTSNGGSFTFAVS